MSTTHVRNLGSNISIPPVQPVVFMAEGEEMRKFRDVINEARKVALLNPLGRNAGPEYVGENGKPACIFGHVLERLGISVVTAQNNFSMFELPWDTWGFERPNYYQSLWTAKVQAAADNGDAWVIAIATADATLI